eukprot:7943287-Alexandrium_andersonii.AAC.1
MASRCTKFGSAPCLWSHFDWFDSLLGSLANRCSCHRVPPWQSSLLSPGPDAEVRGNGHCSEWHLRPSTSDS